MTGKEKVKEDKKEREEGRGDTSSSFPLTSQPFIFLTYHNTPPKRDGLPDTEAVQPNER